MNNILNFDNKMRIFNPENYILDEGLKNAVEIARVLGQPLLLTGEPGTGKTKLAYKVAADLSAEASGLHFFPEPFVFNTKTTSIARDLFYSYDALRHFQVANLHKGTEPAALTDTSNFIELKALGLALAQTQPEAVNVSLFRTKLTDEPRSSVVLIDEIDKAPRDFTNDLLNEVENREFSIQEQGNYRIQQGNSRQVLIIMTSNSEKNLPDAFLRRCIFYHIPFPDSVQLKRIIQSGLPAGTGYTEALLDSLIDTFNEIRKKSVRKPPATAELLAWIHILGLKGIDQMPDKEQKKQMLTNLSVLVKTREDYEAVKSIFQGVAT